MGDDYLVTVCDKCLRASCWHGEFMCDDAVALEASIVQKKASELRELNREHEHHFSRATILQFVAKVEELPNED